MNKLFIALDGDDSGSMVGQAVLMDDVQSLHDTSQKIRGATEGLSQMIASMGGQVISYGGDELVAILNPEDEQKVEEIRQKFQELSGFSATVGTGRTLSQAGKALLAGKLSGKDMVMPYDENTESVLSEAHNAVMSGHGDEEQTKLDEHYLSPTMEDDQDYQEDTEDSEMFADEYPDHTEDSFQGPNIEPETMMEPSMDEEDPMMAPEEYHSEPIDAQDTEEEMSQDAEELPSEDLDFSAEDLSQETEAESDSSFESEPSLDIPADENVLDENSDPEANKADESVEDAGEQDMIEEDMAGAGDNEEILQRVAQNLAMFKENKELMEKIKEANPELYASILGLLQNMIELARTIDPSASESVSEEPETPEDQAPMPTEEMIAPPKQMG